MNGKGEIRPKKGSFTYILTNIREGYERDERV